MWDHARASRLGAALRARRVALGLSQKEIAEAAGITKNQLQLIESGKGASRIEVAAPSNPRMATLVGLASALGTSVSEVLDGADL